MRVGLGVGVGGFGSAERRGPVDEGVGEGVVGHGGAVQAERVNQQVLVVDAVAGGAGDGGDDGGPARVGGEPVGQVRADRAGEGG